MRKKIFKKRKSKYYGSYTNNIESLIINILAVVIIIIAFMYVKNGVIYKNYKKTNISIEKISEFYIPNKSIDIIKELSIKYNVDFIELMTLYCVENNFFENKTVTPTIAEIEKNLIFDYKDIKNKYGDSLKPYKDLLENIITELKYFPLANGFESDDSNTYMFGDSWGTGRTYKNERIHEGTDILDRENIRGRIPIVSMTDGTIEDVGWNELGGFRIGIRTENNNYYYYAHFDSFESNIKKGLKIKAGELLGYMGDTGYSKKSGTTGNFPVHLHVGISPDTNITNEDFWINPYAFLRYIEDKKITVEAVMK